MKWTFGARCVHIGTQFKQSFWICICFKCEILPYIRKKKCWSMLLIRRCTIMLMKIKRPNIFFHRFYMDGNPRTLAPWRRKRTVICPCTAPGAVRGHRARSKEPAPKNPASIIRMPTSAMASRLTARLWGTPPDHFHLQPLSYAGM